MNRCRVWAVAGLAAVVCGCGGGGSGSDGGGGTGLVPDAPPIGAVLYADATTLRPLHAGAVYKYRGMLTPSAVTVRQLVTGLPTVNVFPTGLLLDTGGAFVWSAPMSGSFTPLPSSAGVRLSVRRRSRRSPGA